MENEGVECREDNGRKRMAGSKSLSDKSLPSLGGG